MNKNMADHKLFSLIFNERRARSASTRHHHARRSKKKEDEYEIIVPPSLRKSQVVMIEPSPIRQTEPEFQQKRNENIRRLSFSSNSAAIPLKVDPELRDEASISSLDKEIIQPSSRPHLHMKSIARASPSQRCMVRSRTLQSRLPIPRQNATAGVLAPIAFDRCSNSYNNQSPTSFREIRREIKQIVLDTETNAPDKVHTSKRESRDDSHEVPATDTTNTDSTEKEKQEETATKNDSTCSWWKCW
jgi:hypothetical protein